MNKIYSNEAPKYGEVDLTTTPIKPNSKAPAQAKWQYHIDNVPSAENQKKRLDQYGHCGVAVNMGKRLGNGNCLMAIDVDTDEHVGMAKRIFGPVISGKRGKKGITIFASYEKDQFKKKSSVNIHGYEKGIDILIRGAYCICPPTIHPETNKPYEWIGKPLYECEPDELKLISKVEIDLLQDILALPEHQALLAGNQTHEAALTLTAKLACRYDEQLLIKFLESLLPENYTGNLRDELPEMVRSAKQKNLSGFALYDPVDIGPVPFGYTDNGDYVFLHQKKKILSVKSPNSLMSVPGLCDLAPLSFWLNFQPKYNKEGLPTGQIDHQKIANALMEECRKVGPFIPSRVRGAGFWREGNAIIQNLRGDLPVSDRYAYIRFEQMPEFREESKVDAVLIYDWLKLFHWADEGYATLLLGWLALAPICGAVDWRTHIFIHGAKKTGKSTLIRGMTTLLEPMVISLDGTSTEAGIRQSIGADSRPVIMDEFESDGKTSRMLSIYKLARSASTGAAPIARGTPEGKALQFQVSSAFCFAAIIAIMGTAADQSRIVHLELDPHKDDPKMRNKIEEGQSYLDAHRMAWSHQMAEHINEIVSSIDIIRQNMPSGDIRHNQNMQNLLGAAYYIVNGKIPSKDEAISWIKSHETAVNILAIAHEEDDSEDCLNHLLSFKTKDDVPLSYLLLDENSDAGSGVKAVNCKELLKYGIKRLDDGFLVANKHSELNRIFKETLWANNGWKNALKRLKNAEVGNQHRTRFLGGPVVRCVYIPFKLIMDE